MVIKDSTKVKEHITTGSHQTLILETGCWHIAIMIERFIKKQKNKKLIQSLVDGRILSGILAQQVKVPYVRNVE